ncbi:hypothetical protein GGI12_003547, partial [Dipsacomyces acuminosporus]
LSNAEENGPKNKASETPQTAGQSLSDQVRSASRNIYALLASSKPSTASTGNKDGGASPESYDWHNDLMQTLGSIATGFIPDTGSSSKQPDPKTPESKARQNVDKISWASTIRSKLETLSAEIQDSNWGVLPPTTQTESSPAANVLLKDQLLEQISDLRAQLNDQISDMRDAIGDAVQGALPEQLQRPWVDSCARLYLDRAIYPEINDNIELRYSTDICNDEAEFRRRRAEQIRKDFAEFIGVAEATIDARDIPIIAVAGSGGGFRAMVSSIGSFRAMYDAGLFQCITYNAAVSGSSWALAALHTYGNNNPYTVLENVRRAMQSSMFSTANLVSLVTKNDDIAKKTFADMAARYIIATGINEDTLVTKQTEAPDGAHASSSNTATAEQAGLIDRLISETKRQIGRLAELGSPNQSRTKAELQAELQVLAPSTMDELLAVAKSALHKLSAPSFSIVELYGALLFKQLIVQRTVDADGNLKLFLDPQWMKLSSQRKGLDAGEMPMPIYTAVRHFIGSTDNQADIVEDEHHRYEWFELNPFEVGSIDHGAWAPTWGFGRPVENGKELFRIGELHFGSIMGTVASAFCASVKAMVMEVYLVAPGPVRAALDQLLDRFERNTSVAHIIPPYTLFNPFYRSDMRSGTPRLEELQSNPFLALMDSGLENNLPFAPLLRPERDVDMIICLDSSADIELMPWFARAELWAKEHGTKRWPWGSRPWKSDPLRPNCAEIEIANRPGNTAVKDAASRVEDSMLADNVRCAIFDKPVAPSPLRPARMPCLTVLYLPLLPNSNFHDPGFDPAKAAFCATFNDQWTSEQVDKLADLASLNLNQELERIRQAVRKAYERKKAWREYVESNL